MKQTLKMDAKPRSDEPHGMEPYDLGDSGDLGALSREQQTKLNSFKVLFTMCSVCNQILQPMLGTTTVF